VRDARIRSKLGLIMIVPVAAIVALAGLQLAGSGKQALDADQVSSLAGLSVKVSAMSQALHKERMAAADFLAEPTDVKSASFSRLAKLTDEAVSQYRSSRGSQRSVPAGVDDRLRRIDDQLPAVAKIRQEVQAQSSASISEILVRYGVIINALVDYRSELDRITDDQLVASSLRAVAAFSKAKSQIEEEQAVAYSALISGSVDPEEFSSFLGTLTAQQEAFIAFALAATQQQRQIVNSTITGDAIDLADQVATQLRRSVGAPPASPDQAKKSALAASQAIGAVDDLMRFAEQGLDTNLIRDANALRSAVLRQVIIESAVVLLALILAIVVASIFARSMARSLARLRRGALSVANRDLPEAVARLRDIRDLGDDTPERIASSVRDPIQLDSRDEIGQVAEAFNVVHRNAVRIAAEQAALRTSVSAMFLNLARRSQALVDRMIGELDEIERGEEDPKRLSRLFRLDHLATRMRRNDENLLVLAGADSSPPRREDALLIDALRAAQSEIELYDRIEFSTVDQDVSVASHAVNDVVRLAAELLDNATRFSPPGTSVVVDGRRIGDYVLIQIEDRGLGMNDEQLAALNARLAAAPSVDVSAFRMMGLGVVSRLAARYQIKVELRPNAEGGTVANVSLPANILVLPRIRGRGQMIGRPRSALAIEWQPGVPAPATGYPPVNGNSVGLQPTTSYPAAQPANNQPAGNAHGNGHPVIPRQPEPVPVPVPVPAAQPVAPMTETVELPIFREIEAVWFRSHNRSVMDGWSSAPVPTVAAPAVEFSVSTESAVPTQLPPPLAPPLHPAPPPPAPPSPSEEDLWRTRADDGWRAASAAAQPAVAGTTRSGLAKRIPAANLVPGGVDQSTPVAKARRSPEEIRGLLSAYHRGVQRGRTGDAASSVASPQSSEEHR
jgi:hypothetical protein